MSSGSNQFREDLIRYGFVIDQDTCIGCHACTVACKTEHQVPLGVNRTWVKYIEKGEWPDTRRFFSVLRCNHCSKAPCVDICPTTALFRREDGIVDFDISRCIGCKSCMQACPYDALYIDPVDETAQKCNYCVHRVEVGLEPACVVVCPERSIIAGDLDDPTSRIAGIVATEEVFVRAPEQGTAPNLFYKGAQQANLDPLQAVDPGDGGIWRDAPGTAESWLAVDLGGGDAALDAMGSLHDEINTASSPPVHIDRGRPGAAPRVVYNTDHPMPWGWRVSSYFLTKGISAGVAIASAIALAAGAKASSPWFSWVAPLIAGILLALTGVLLVWDLKRPDRFHYLLTKGNFGSWLVRGAWILALYAAALAVWFIAGIAGVTSLVEATTWVAAVVALGVAGYTAFLFGQAEARDLWQGPTLLWHMLAGAFAVGGGVSLVAALIFDLGSSAELAFAWTVLGATAVLGLVAVVEAAWGHPTKNGAAAAYHLTRGRFAVEWWLGGQVAGVVIPVALATLMLFGAGLVAGAIAGVAAAVGIWFADDAFVRAGQSVPIS